MYFRTATTVIAILLGVDYSIAAPTGQDPIPGHGPRADDPDTMTSGSSIAFCASKLGSGHTSIAAGYNHDAEFNKGHVTCSSPGGSIRGSPTFPVHCQSGTFLLIEKSNTVAICYKLVAGKDVPAILPPGQFGCAHAPNVEIGTPWNAIVGWTTINGQNGQGYSAEIYQTLPEIVLSRLQEPRFIDTLKGPKGGSVSIGIDQFRYTGESALINGDNLTACTTNTLPAKYGFDVTVHVGVIYKPDYSGEITYDVSA